MTIGDNVRFMKDGRFGEWGRGDLGCIESILATRPAATADIYMIRLLDDNTPVWATHEDIEFSHGEQLTLF